MSDREQFEAWVLKNWQTVHRENGRLTWHDSSVGAAIGHAWDGWQAARAQPAQAGQVLTDEEIEAAWYECDDYETKRAYFDAGVHWAQKAVLAKRVPMPPEDWSVFNSGAEVASGLTWAEAWDYMTPSRIERGWTAVCVANKSNIGIVGEKGGA